MSFPWQLQPGLVSIYGVGFTSPPQGPTIAQEPLIYGVIYQAFSNQAGRQVGDKVYFSKNDIVCQLAYAGDSYTLFPEAKIIITESLYLP
jgi:hypothetical protein